MGLGSPPACPCPRSVTQPRSPRPLLASAPSTRGGEIPGEGWGTGNGRCGTRGRGVPGGALRAQVAILGCSQHGGVFNAKRCEKPCRGGGFPHPKTPQPSQGDPITCLQ